LRYYNINIKICNIKPPQLPFLSCFIHVEDVYKHRSRLSGMESQWGRDFPRPFKLAVGPIPPPAPWVPCLSRGIETGAWRWPPTSSSAELKESVELYLYCPSGRALVIFSRANFTYGVLQLPLLLVRTVICRCSNQAAGCTAEQLLCDCRCGQDIFPLSTPSRPTLGPTQHFPPGQSSRNVNPTTLHLMSKLRMSGAIYLHFHVALWRV
jgi:hypothetical protein